MPNLVSVSMLAFEKIKFLSFCGNKFRIERVKNESYKKMLVMSVEQAKTYLHAKFDDSEYLIFFRKAVLIYSLMCQNKE